MKINWKIRFENPVFIFQLILSVLLPILAYVGLSVEDVTSWQILAQLITDAVMNPYCLGLVVLSVYNTIVSPTSKGASDDILTLAKKKL